MPLLLGDYIQSKAIRGAIMGLDNLLAVLLIPFIGAMSDRTDTRIGNRLPFIVVGMPIAALFFMLIPFGAGINFWALIIVDIIFLIAMTIFRAPVIALMPDHTPTAKRSTANGIINFMGGVGAIVALFGLSILYGIDRAFPFIVAGLLLLITFILLFLTIDRNPPYVEKIKESSDEIQASNSLFEGLKLLRKPQFRGHLYILVAIFLYFFGYAGVESQFTVYAVEYLKFEESTAGFTLGFFSLAFLLFAIPAGLLGSKWGKTRTMLTGLILQPLIFISIPVISLFSNINQLLYIQIILFIGGVAWAFINVQAYPLVADLGGKNRIGFFTGLYYLFSMASAIVAPGFLGLFMDLFTPPALFYCAATSFLVAFYFLKKGSEIVQNHQNSFHEKGQL